jgi:hypothetical protein
LNKRTFALQNGERNTEVFPLLNLTNTYVPLVSMLEIADHVAVLTILHIEKSEPKRKK